jgi:hypothetical protein
MNKTVTLPRSVNTYSTITVDLLSRCQNSWTILIVPEIILPGNFLSRGMSFSQQFRRNLFLLDL